MIRKTVVVAVLAAFITIVYVGVVVGVGAFVAGTATEGPLPIIAAVVIAVAFQPVRARANRIANRFVLGERATPYQVLSAFSERLAGAYASDDLLTRMATLIGQGSGVRRAVVWLRIGEEVLPAASWPPDDLGGSSAPVEEPRRLVDGGLPELGGSRALDVRHEGELLGAISVEERPGEPLSHEAEQLLEHLASQAGLVLRNARLTEELRARLVELQASRKRIVAAQDEERRRLERNLHDGAQQQLVALAVKQRLVGTLLTRDPEKAAALVEDLQRDTGEALDNLRDLARGIYPPLLADKGSALESQAGKAAVPDARRGARGRPVRAGGRGRRLLLLPRGSPERREVCPRGWRRDFAPWHRRGAGVRGGRRRRRFRPGSRASWSRADEHGRPPGRPRRRARGALAPRGRHDGDRARSRGDG